MIRIVTVMFLLLMQSCGPSPRTPFPEAYYGLSLGMSIKDFEKRYPDLQKLPQRLGHIDSSRDPGRVGVTRTYIKEYLLRSDRMMRVICNPAESKRITKIVFMKPEHGVKFYRPREIKPSDSSECSM